MKKLIASLSLVVLVGIATASAERYDTRVDVARAAAEQNREFRGESEYRGHRDYRAAAQLDQLNRDLRRVREQIRHAGAGQHIWARFRQASIATDRLNTNFRRGRISGREVRYRAEQIKTDLYRLQKALRGPRHR